MRYVQTALLSMLLAAPAFATEADSPALSSAEQTYYRSIFDYVMDHTKDGERYEWKTYGGSGGITPEAPFTSKSGYTCRNFKETMIIQEQASAGNGTACKRVGREGWCKLKPGNAQTCAMEEPPSVLDMNMPTGKWNSFKASANRATNKTTSWFKELINSFE